MCVANASNEPPVDLTLTASESSFRVLVKDISDSRWATKRPSCCAWALVNPGARKRNSSIFIFLELTRLLLPVLRSCRALLVQSRDLPSPVHDRGRRANDQR